MVNILICDEKTSDVESLMNILDYYGTGVRTRICYNTTDALSYISQTWRLIDICFFELDMQGMNGIELARKVRAEGYKDGIVFISASRAYGPETFEVKALGYLLKPLMPQDVRSIVDKWKAERKCHVN